jgi:hypothetical protein
MTQIQGVALGVLPKSLCANGVHWTIEYVLHQTRNFSQRERLQFKAFQMLVFPDSGDGVRRGFSRADCQDDGGEATGDELVNSEGRQVIQEVGVIDTDDHLAGIADEPIDNLAYPPKGIRAEVAGDVGEGAQGDAARRSGADDPMPARVTPARACDRFAGHPGLADTGSAGQHDATAAVDARPGRLGDQSKLLRAPYQGPLADHRQSLTAAIALLLLSSKREISPRKGDAVTTQAEVNPPDGTGVVDYANHLTARTLCCRRGTTCRNGANGTR